MSNKEDSHIILWGYGSNVDVKLQPEWLHRFLNIFLHVVDTSIS